MHSYIIAFIGTLIFIRLLIPFAHKAGLVDVPVGRKQHMGSIPLVGGMAMFLGFLLSVLTLSEIPVDYNSFLFAAVVLIVVGVVDDRDEVGVRLRFSAQLLTALIMTSTAGHVIGSMGDILGTGNVLLGDWAIPFTVFAVLGVTNALNMADGIDGLAGSVSLISFLSMFYLAADAGSPDAKLLLIFISVLVPFLVFNLPYSGKRTAKVFMGDAGSMFLGYSLAWFFIDLSQGENAIMTPITTLWCFAIPLFDTVSIMLRRLLKGHSPFRPDRDHFHHIFLAAGFSNRRTLIIIVMTQVIMSSIGIIGYKLGVPESLMFFSYLALFALFFWALKRAWYVMRALRQMNENVEQS